MKAHRMLTAVLALGVVAGLAYVQQAAEPAGPKMVGAADKFLASLTPEQKAKANLAFTDDERFNWHFVPLQDAQRKPTRKESDRGPRGPIKERPVGRLYDADEDWRAQDDDVEMDDVATSAKQDDGDDDDS